MRILLPRPDDFDLPATVTSHGWYRLAPFEWDEARELLTHTDVVSECVSRISIRQSPKRIIVESTVDVPENELVRRVSRMLQLRVDLSDFYERCRRSDRLRVVPERGLGRLLCAPALFEDAIKIILTTNTRWARTVEMNRRLVEAFGRKGKDSTAFPGPAELTAAGEEGLRDLGRVGYRARSIYRLADELASRRIDPASRPASRDASYEESYAWYLKLPGIGPYGAAHLMAMDGRHDRIAVDTEFRAWVRENYHGGRHVSDRTMLRHYRHWGPWKYIAYWCEMAAS